MHVILLTGRDVLSVLDEASHAVHAIDSQVPITQGVQNVVNEPFLPSASSDGTG